jgi:hypothetical protein
MANKKISQFEEVFELADGAYIPLANNGANFKISGANLKAALTTIANEVLSYTVPANSSYAINLGAYPTFTTFIINYSSTRGSRYRSGILIVKAYSPTQAECSEGAPVIIPNEFGQTGGITSFSADVSSGQVRLIVNTDNEDATNTYFNIMVKTL